MRKHSASISARLAVAVNLGLTRAAGHAIGLHFFLKGNILLLVFSVAQAL